nr:MerR family DNA-binding transcriptional regulator [Candidatus Saccharibacteria bacterium]
MTAILPGKKTLSISDAASFLGVSPATLRRWDKQGKLKAFRTKGGQRRYSVDTLEAYRRGEVKPPKLAVSEAAEYVGVHPETLRRWEREGIIEPERTKGGQRRYTPGELDKLVSKEVEEEVPVAAPPPRPKVALPKRELPPLPPKPPKIPVEPVEAPRPPPLPKIRKFASSVVVPVVVVLLALGASWMLMSDLGKERLKRAFGPAPLSPIVDINDIAEYKTANNVISALRFRFPLETSGLVAETLTVLEEGMLNTTRFLGTVFFGQGNDYFISPLGDAYLGSIIADSIDTSDLSSSTITVSQLNVGDLVVSGTSSGVTGTGGGGIATGGDADTLEGQPGSYYLSWSNFTGTPVVLSSLNSVVNNEGNIDLIAGANIIITPDDAANTVTIAFSGVGLDADTLDGLDSLQFLRSDTNDFFTSGTLTFNSSTELTINSGATLSVLGTFTCTDCIDSTHVTDIYLFNNGDTGTGSYVFEDDVTLGLTSANTLIVNALVSSNIIPIDNTRD